MQEPYNKHRYKTPTFMLTVLILNLSGEYRQPISELAAESLIQGSLSLHTEKRVYDIVIEGRRKVHARKS